MKNKTKLVRIRDVLTETQRCSISRLFRTYGLKLTKMMFTIKRCDMREVSKSCSYISLEDIDNLLEKLESKFSETKNFNTKESISLVKAIKKDVESFLNKKEKHEHTNS